ncbi:hypothetical protein GRS48_09495 [Halorubrum sp. JWXQ-INN 858]|uniref:DUF5789 family protein n=1 Tax=Halorubrum sp. JWXQ-INN 858 TaxID=2690782 RepID=UPI00135964F8|nr:hypothetical protein [Halorubrum sp. JWXQ-INN 858]MWV65050.1 hypothetical protein [Halorubrum sp. JWXQ-INN 858]
MSDEINLSRLEGRLEDGSYPASREELAEAYAGTTVLYADGEDDLGDLIEAVDQDSFNGSEDVFVALQNVLPIEALGEPGQSDGDA